jgi:YD repeat-containing protein
MSQHANYLASVGQTTSSVADLWGFEVAGASAALNPIRYLAGAVDASVAAPGLPLTFSRVYGQDMASRFRSGPMGRGWTHNWDIRWSAADNGDITLHGPGGVDRFFTKNKNGTYLASPGDYGTLTLAGSVFTLVETDQTRWQFRSDGGLNFVADTNGNRITLGYTAGLLTSLTHSNGRQLVLGYSGEAGTPQLLSSVMDAMGPGSADDRVTTYEYDTARQHLLRVVEPGNRVTQYSYAPVTQLPFKVYTSKADEVTIAGIADPRSHALLSVTHVDGKHDYFAYDARGRLIETKQDGNTERVTFTYVSEGGVNVTDATGRATLLNFGLGGQLAQVRDADGRIVLFGYDSKFQFSQLGGPGGEQYRYAYDAKGNLTGIRDALNLETSFAYEPSFNRLAGFTDARGNGIDYQYNAQGNLTRITYEDLSHEDFAYDSFGNAISATNRRGQEVRYEYNPAGQVASKDYVATPGIDFTYQYDVAGNLTRATDAGGTTEMTYDPLTDRLTRIEYPGGKFFLFAYDAAGRRTRRTDQDGNIEKYAYDSLGRLDFMTRAVTGLPAESMIVDYNYDLAGRLSKKTLGNGVYTTYVYDNAGNLKNLVNFKPDNTVLSRYDYEYDLSGRRTSMTTLAGRFDYGYDALGQLVNVRCPDGHAVAYDYDEAGNRRQVIDDGTATEYTTNNLNQYTEVGGVTYAFDADGNLIRQAENGVTTIYAYDTENRLTGVTTPTDSWAYSYDALGNRVAATHNGQATRYVIDPTGLGNVAAEYNDFGNLIARYDHGYGLLSRTDTAGVAYYTFQAIGHTSELTGTGGTVLNSYQYDPFGVSIGKTETVTNRSSMSASTA